MPLLCLRKDPQNRLINQEGGDGTQEMKAQHRREWSEFSVTTGLEEAEEWTAEVKSLGNNYFMDMYTWNILDNVHVAETEEFIQFQVFSSERPRGFQFLALCR